MKAGVVRGVDLLAVGAALGSALMAMTYVRVIDGQGDQPQAWVLGILVVAAVLAVYGAPVRSPHRRAALMAAGVGLVVLGVLAILSIGLPILASGGLALLASARPVTGQTT